MRFSLYKLLMQHSVLLTNRTCMLITLLLVAIKLFSGEVRVPKWFTHPSEGEYVGVSIPFSDNELTEKNAELSAILSYIFCQKKVTDNKVDDGTMINGTICIDDNMINENSKIISEKKYIIYSEQDKPIGEIKYGEDSHSMGIKDTSLISSTRIINFSISMNYTVVKKEKSKDGICWVSIKPSNSIIAPRDPIIGKFKEIDEYFQYKHHSSRKLLSSFEMISKDCSFAFQNYVEDENNAKFSFYINKLGKEDCIEILNILAEPHINYGNPTTIECAGKKNVGLTYFWGLLESINRCDIEQSGFSQLINVNNSFAHGRFLGKYINFDKNDIDYPNIQIQQVEKALPLYTNSIPERRNVNNKNVDAQIKQEKAQTLNIKPSPIVAKQKENSDIEKNEPQTTISQKRIALIMGNGSYSSGRLDNPTNDAYDLAKKLESLGFKTILRTNQRKRDMKMAISDFCEKAQKYDAALFYYAGHALQNKGINYLMPIGATIRNNPDIEYECVDLNWVLESMEDAKVNIKIIVLDACRNNPIARSWERGSGNSGLAETSVPEGTFLVFATQAGKVAKDGENGQRNSPYANALLQVLDRPMLPIHDVFREVRKIVVKQTNNEQIPSQTDNLIGDFYFNMNKR